jgi:putative transposase
MFQDEAGFGRIGTPHRCWTGGKRPCVPCHHIREYRYAYGAVSAEGESYFLVMPRSDTLCMNYFLKALSQAYSEDYLLVVCDNAIWHKSKSLEVPENIQILHIPPYTPEMNPIEQIWKELRKMGFSNRLFQSLNDVIDQLCESIRELTREQISSIVNRDWVFKAE